MGLVRLRTHEFSSALELCQFVNDNSISVLGQIVFKNNAYVLFYRE